MHSKINIDSLEIIEWYDGPVTAVAGCDNFNFLVVLIACKLPEDERIYVILSIDDTSVRNLLQSLEGDRPLDTEEWKAVMEQLNQLLREYRGDVYLTEEDPEQGKTINIYLDPSLVPFDLVPYDSESAFDDQRFETWEHRLEELKG